jgi:hypothetical protein
VVEEDQAEPAQAAQMMAEVQVAVQVVYAMEELL